MGVLEHDRVFFQEATTAPRRSRRPERNTKERLVQAFKNMDVNGDGSLSLDELTAGGILITLY